MIHTTDFFQEQIKQCGALAVRASNKADREFWLTLTRRWEGLLRAQENGGAAAQIIKTRFERPIFAKRRQRAKAA